MISFYLLFVLIAAAFFDWTSARIPNQLIIMEAAGPLIYFLMNKDSLAVKETMLSILAVFTLLFPLFCVGAFGAGDVKLLMFLPGYFQRQELVNCFFLTFLSGAVLGVAKLLFGRIGEEVARKGAVPKEAAMNKGGSDVGLHKIHFAIPICIAVCIVLLRGELTWM